MRRASRIGRHTNATSGLFPVALPILVFEFCRTLRRGGQPAGTAHRNPVIFVDSPTAHAHLIILPVNTAMRPRELMLAEYFEEPLEEFSCHDCY